MFALYDERAGRSVFPTRCPLYRAALLQADQEASAILTCSLHSRRLSPTAGMLFVRPRFWIRNWCSNRGYAVTLKSFPECRGKSDGNGISTSGNWRADPHNRQFTTTVFCFVLHGQTSLDEEPSPNLPPRFQQKKRKTYRTTIKPLNCLGNFSEIVRK